MAIMHLSNRPISQINGDFRAPFGRVDPDQFFEQGGSAQGKPEGTSGNLRFSSP